MNKYTTQQGSAHVVIVICLVLGLVTALGWIFYQNFIHKETPQKDTELVVVNKDSDARQDSERLGEQNDPNKGYLVIKDWGLRFKVPSGLTDVQYRIHDDQIGFFAKPTGKDVEYRSDYDTRDDDGIFTYAIGFLLRSKESTQPFSNPGFEEGVKGKKVGNYYYYTWHSFSGLQSGAASNGLFLPNDDCWSYPQGENEECDALFDAESEAFQLMNTKFLRSIEKAQ